MGRCDTPENSMYLSLQESLAVVTRKASSLVQNSSPRRNSPGFSPSPIGYHSSARISSSDSESQSLTRHGYGIDSARHSHSVSGESSGGLPAHRTGSKSARRSRSVSGESGGGLPAHRTGSESALRSRSVSGESGGGLPAHNIGSESAQRSHSVSGESDTLQGGSHF